MGIVSGGSLRGLDVLKLFLLQYPVSDLTHQGLGQLVPELDVVGHGVLGDVLTAVAHKCVLGGLALFHAGLQHHKGLHASVSAPSAQEADNGIWFADLKNNKTPIFEVKTDNFGAAGLWAANGDTYTISSEGAFEFKTLEEPAAPTETGTFLMCSNPNTFTITLKQSAYILTTDGTSFEQEANPEIKPFQSFVLTDAKTLSTLRSLRIGDGVVTGNQTIEPVDGYYVTTDRGAIVIHTPEPMDVVIIGMNGKVAYRGEVTDGQRIMVPSGIYAVNGQLVRVK